MFQDNEKENQNAVRASAKASPAGARTAPAAPLSNTGRKSESQTPVPCAESELGIYDGERIELIATAAHDGFVRHPIPNESASPYSALVDWLAFTVKPPAQVSLMQRADGLENSGYRWMCAELVRIFNVDAKSIERQKTGGNGYENRAAIPGGFVYWGGRKQRGTVHVSLSGEGCARIENAQWPIIAGWLQEHQAKLTRVDLAHDDFDAQIVNMQRAVEWYKQGGFNAGGRTPEHNLKGDWLDSNSPKGRTLNVGNRKNGKLCRIYEKGKEQGDPTSPWVRFEVEWRAKSRVLPYDMLTQPGKYLAGAYPCAKFLNIEQCKIKTLFRGGKITFDRALDNLRQQGGKLINFALSIFGGDYAQLVERIRRDGIPSRLEPYDYHIQRMPEAFAGLGVAGEYAN